MVSARYPFEKIILSAITRLESKSSGALPISKLDSCGCLVFCRDLLSKIKKMSLEPDSTPSRAAPPLVSTTSPSLPPRSSFGQIRHEAFADNVFRSTTDLQVSNMENSGISQTKSLCDGRLASLKAEEAGNRRFQAAAWLKSMVESQDMPHEPSEKEFRFSLRNGIILCNLINKVQPGAVFKVVANHDSSLPPEARPLSAYQYFENVRNFLVAVEDMKLPTFEASHLEQESLQPGSTTKIVDCILALKVFYEWKQCGVNGLRSPMIPRNTGNFLQCSTPCVPVKAPETLPNPSVRSMDDGEKRSDDYSPFQSQDPKPLGTNQEHQMRLVAQRKEVTDIRDLLQTAREVVQVLQAEWRRNFELLDKQVARVNKESGEVRELKEQVESLKKALAKKEAEVAHLQSMKECQDDKLVRSGEKARKLVGSGEKERLKNNETSVGKQCGNLRQTMFFQLGLRTTCWAFVLLLFCWALLHVLCFVANVVRQ